MMHVGMIVVFGAVLDQKQIMIVMAIVLWSLTAQAIVVFWEKRVVIGRKWAHAVKKAPVMAWIHAGFVGAITQAALTVQVYHVLMRM